jgi:hypothetical protein
MLKTKRKHRKYIAENSYNHFTVTKMPEIQSEIHANRGTKKGLKNSEPYLFLFQQLQLISKHNKWGNLHIDTKKKAA